jgi:anaerobic magnesium-protoporphyrin IX monomethyl ester cyclase
MKTWVLNPPFLKNYSRAQRSPAVTKSGTIYFPMWLAYCVGYLEKNGIDTMFNDAPAEGTTHEDVIAQGIKLNPGLVIMDTSTPSIDNDLEFAAKLKAAIPGVFICLVGTHASATTEESLVTGPAIDAVAKNEYELTMLDLARALQADGRNADLSKIPGLHFRQGDKIIHNPDRPFTLEVEDIPWVSKTYKKYLNIEDYFNPNALFPMVTLLSGRGCPFSCTFCVYPQTVGGKRYRYRDVKDMVDEMEYIVREFPNAKSIFFEDDTLTLNQKRCVELSEEIIRRKVKISWTCNSRIDTDYETLKKMHEAGLRQVCVGFESGSQEVLDGMKKGTKVEKMMSFMDGARRAGVLVHGCFMFGFLNDTDKTVKETLDVALQLNPDTAQFYPLMVYPGTEAYNQYKAKGWLTKAKYSEWLTPEGLHSCVIRNERFSPEELVRLCDDARRKFYLRPSYWAYKARQLVRHPKEIRRTMKSARTFAKYLWAGSKV